MSTTAIKEDIGAFFGAGPAASGAVMETTEEEKEATEAAAAAAEAAAAAVEEEAPEEDSVPGQVAKWPSQVAAMPVSKTHSFLYKKIRFRHKA